MSKSIIRQNSFYCYEKKFNPTEELPPTPSSTVLSFYINEKEFMDDASEQSSLRSQSSRYGSIESNGSSSGSKTTISPNDDDEGLYLLWTHQLLKERGYEPSPLKQIINDDTDSIDSSITDYSSASQQKKSWFSYWFPFCI